MPVPVTFQLWVPEERGRRTWGAHWISGPDSVLISSQIRAEEFGIE